MISGMLADSFAHQSIDGYNPRERELVKLLGLSEPAVSGANVTPRSVVGFSPVFRAINLIGNAVAKCGPIIYERLDSDGRPDPEGRNKRRAKEHPNWLQIVERPNPWMSAGELYKLITINAILRGNGLAYATRDGAGKIIQILPLPPDRTGMVIFDQRAGDDAPLPENAEILYWTKIGDETRTLLPENVLHIRGLSSNGIWGMDVIDVMRETLGLGIAARDCAARFYGQGMLASGVLYMPPGIAAGIPAGPKREEAVAKFIKRIKDQAAGLSKAHRLLVVDEGAKFEPMTIDPQKAQALEGREFAVREVANIIGCQAHKLGDTKRTSYSSLEQSNQEHLDDDIDPWLARTEEALERLALTDREQETGSHYVECNRKALMRTNMAARGAYYAQARNGGWMSANDVRRAEGDDGIGPQGDVYLVPLNSVPAEQLINGAIGVPPGDDSEDDEGVRLAADYRTVAMHELTRLVTRACEEATRKAAKGGADYVRFIDVLSEWCYEPAPLRPVLQAVGVRLATEFDRFTKPPFAAADLITNLAAAIERIKRDTLAFAATQLELSP